MSHTAPYPENYQTPSRAFGLLSARFPTLSFYTRATQIVFKAAHLSKKGFYNDDLWIEDSAKILRALEYSGCRVSIENTESFRNLDSPCVFIANHMSTLETFVLPTLLQPYRDITFVVKESLTRYPVFKDILGVRRPICVSRVNPREDLKTVLEQGAERLSQNCSVIIFPQSTRCYKLNPENFTSLGVKLARKAGVPVIPIALDTRAWGMGKIVKDMGKINPTIPIRFRFGNPLTVTGTGKLEHAQTCEFIMNVQKEWFTACPLKHA